MQDPSSTPDWCMSKYNVESALMSVSGTDLGYNRFYHGLSDATMSTRYMAHHSMPLLNAVEKHLMRRLFSLRDVRLQ